MEEGSEEQSLKLLPMPSYREVWSHIAVNSGRILGSRGGAVWDWRWLSGGVGFLGLSKHAHPSLVEQTHSKAKVPRMSFSGSL